MKSGSILYDGQIEDIKNRFQSGTMHGGQNHHL